MKTVMTPQSQTVHMVSSGSVMKSDRRASKPLMEKRRRERINKSLNELKSILLNALRKDQSTCHSKLEKADILEMTVRYLRGIQRQRLNAAMTLDPNVVNKYRSGFMECKNEVSHFLDNSIDNVQSEVKSRLINHLGNSIPQPHLPHHMMGQNPGAPRLLTTAPPVTAVNAISPLPIQMSPNTQIHQAMAAAAAAMAQNRVMMQPAHPGISYTVQESLESRYSGRDVHSASPVSSPTHSPISSHYVPCSSAEEKRRHNSGSSFASSGFASPGSPITASPSISPKKPSSENLLAQHSIQGNFVVIPQSLTASHHSPVTVENQQSRANVSPKTSLSSVEKHYPISHSSTPTKIESSSRHTSSPVRSFSPASSSGSDVDSEPVWRPW